MDSAIRPSYNQLGQVAIPRSQYRYSTRSPTSPFFCPTFFTAAILLASGFGFTTQKNPIDLWIEFGRSLFDKLRVMFPAVTHRPAKIASKEGFSEEGLGPKKGPRLKLVSQSWYHRLRILKGCILSTNTYAFSYAMSTMVENLIK